jgi:UDPglucose 6-dehydrogenase
VNIAVIGTGYVGLVTGTCFADVGNNVTCIDIDDSKVEKLRSGKVTIYEPGLEDIFQRNIADGRLTFTQNLSEGIENAEIIFLSLPTPPQEDGSADLSYVLKVADDLGSLLKSYVVVVDKSTVPVGTAEKVKLHIRANYSGEFDVASNPEFLREGFAVNDFMHPERIVIGSSSDRARSILQRLYAPFTQQDSNSELYLMDERSAELTKYAANSFLATKISFMNEIANLCEKVGADVDAVRLGIGSDGRIGKRFLFPGIGFGGSCFPKDVKALQHTAHEHGDELHILNAVVQVNTTQKHRLTEKIIAHYKDDLKGKRFALWGLAFKPDTDDIRESPALLIVDALTSKGAEIVAYDPKAMENVQRHHPAAGLHLADDPYEALEGADALLVATEWPVFREPDLARIKRLLAHPVIFDGRNLYQPATLRGLGFEYHSIGRPN